METNGKMETEAQRWNLFWPRSPATKWQMQDLNPGVTVEPMLGTLQLAGNKDILGPVSSLHSFMPLFGQLCPRLTPAPRCPLGRAMALSERPWLADGSPAERFSEAPQNVHAQAQIPELL